VLSPHLWLPPAELWRGILGWRQCSRRKPGPCEVGLALSCLHCSQAEALCLPTEVQVKAETRTGVWTGTA
jgi:hypothetical protein